MVLDLPGLQQAHVRPNSEADVTKIALQAAACNSFYLLTINTKLGKSFHFVRLAQLATWMPLPLGQSSPLFFERFPPGRCHRRSCWAVRPAKVQFPAGYVFRLDRHSHSNSINREPCLAGSASRDSAVLEPRLDPQADALEQQVVLAALEMEIPYGYISHTANLKTVLSLTLPDWMDSQAS